MPTRKISERERLTIYARTATDEQLDEAIEILAIEARIRKGKKPTASPKRASKKPAAAGPQALPPPPTQE